jgi:integrase
MAQRKPGAPSKRRYSDDGSYSVVGKARNGAGSVSFDTKTNRWVARVSLGKDDAGKPIRKTVYGRTQAEAQAKLITVQGAQQRGTLPTARGRADTIQAFATEWLAGRAGKRNERTIARNRSFLKPALDAFGNKQLTTLEPADVDRLLSRMLKNGASASTVRGTRATLRAMLNTAIRQNKLHDNAAANSESITVRKKSKRVMSQEHVKMLTASAAQARDGYLYALLANTGMRISEALGLTWDLYDPKTGRLHVRYQLKTKLRKEDPTDPDNPEVLPVTLHPQERYRLELLKTENAERDIDLSGPARAILDAVRQRYAEERLQAGTWGNDVDLIFTNPKGRPLDAVTLTKKFHEFTDKLGIPRLNPHDLRHTVATYLLHVAGAPLLEVSRMLGHANVSITLNLYGHSTDAGKAQVASMLSGIGGT